MFVAPSELCAKCYAFVSISELISPSHIPYHITSLLQTSKSKNIATLKKQFLVQR